MIAFLIKRDRLNWHISFVFYLPSLALPHPLFLHEIGCDPQTRKSYFMSIRKTVKQWDVIAER